MLITAPKADINEIEERQKRYAQMREENEKQKKLKKLETQQEEAKAEKDRILNEYDKKESSLGVGQNPMSAKGIEKARNAFDNTDFTIRESAAANTATKKSAFVCDFDEDEVPPLE